MRALRLRKSEWVFLGFFAYILLLEPFFRDRENLHWQPLLLLLAMAGLFLGLAWVERGKAGTAIGIVRDWLPVGLTLVAFREMELFLPRHFSHTFETAWIRWDDCLLRTWRLRFAIEYFGKAIPWYLEFCYLLVYGTGAVSIWLLYARRHRENIDRFLLIYLLGTLGAYALFPFFPSEPPRLVFPQIDPPQITTWTRRFNLFILRKGTIHVGVFPSAHVSSAFSAAWGILVTLPRQKWIGLLMLFYAFTVLIATVYGRYHYLADVLAGAGVSLVMGAICWLAQIRDVGGKSGADT